MKNPFSMVGRVRWSHIIAVGLAVGAMLWIASGAMTEKPPAERVGKNAATPAEAVLVRVRASKAEARERFVTLFGRTEAVKSIELAAETAGQVVARPVRKGAWVKKGDTILRLAMDDRQARLKEAEAKVGYQRLIFESARKLSQKQFQSKLKVVEASAALESAKAALAAVRLDIQRATLRAPVDGFVETLPANVGDYVKIGDKVAALVDLDPIRIVAQVAEGQVARLKTGDKAWIVLPGGISRQGDVRFISRVGAVETRTFRVEVWIENADATVPEGWTAEVRLKTGAAQAHRVSPAVLTLDDNGVIGVKAVDATGRVTFHAAEILEDTTEGIWLSDLPAELTLITVGQEFVRPGEVVRTKDEAAPAKPAVGAPGVTENRT